MTVKLIHTSDWQIGKVFRFLDNAAMGLLQEARLRAITRLGELAGCTGQPTSWSQVMSMTWKRCRPVRLTSPWNGCADSRAPSGICYRAIMIRIAPTGFGIRLLRKGLPENVRVHIALEPAMLQSEAAVLLPAPLFHRRTLDDLTAYMDDVNLPEGLVRVGLAHGTVRGFGSDDKDVPNFIAPDRPSRAGLSYLALGDWHGQKQINDRCWYSGTPEIDAFDVIDGGQALLVEIEGPRAVPAVTPIPTGTLHVDKAVGAGQ